MTEMIGNAMDGLLQSAVNKAGMDKLSSTGRALQSTSKNEVDRAAKDFEAVFISEMLKPMFEQIETDGMFGGGRGEEIFRGVMIQEIGKSISARGGIGIADDIRAHLLKLQENQDNPLPQPTGV